MVSETEGLARRAVSGRVQSAVVLCCVVALVAQALYLALMPPASGFETSLVEAYHLGFWVAFYGVLAGALLVVVAAAVTGSSLWRHAVVCLSCDYALFVFLPSFRGYYLYGRGASDVLGHFAYVKAILDTGFLPSSLWYPAEHMIVAELTLLGYPLNPSKYLLSLVFTLIYVVSVGVFLREFTGRRTAFLAGLAAAAPLVYTYFHLTLHPFMLSFMLLPAALACAERYRRTGSREHFLLGSLVLVIVVFFHPMTAFFAIVLLGVSELYTRRFGRLVGEGPRPVERRFLYVVVPVWFLWYASLEKTHAEFSGLVTGLLSGRPGGGVVEAGDAAQSGLSGIQILQRFVELYGAIFLYAAVAGLFAVVVALQLRRRRGRFAEGYGATQFAVGVAVAVGFLSTYLVAVGPVRVSRYMILAATLLVGLLLERAVRGDVPKLSGRTATVGLTLIVLSVAVLGANGAYWPNKQMTAAEYHGSEFVMENGREEVQIRGLDTTWKTSSFVAGRYRTPDNSFGTADHPGHLSEHLGYGDGSTAARTFGRSYVTTKTYDLRFYTASYFFPEQRRAMFVYDRTALARMRADPTVDRVYDNGGFASWYVSGSENSSAVGAAGG